MGNNFWCDIADSMRYVQGNMTWRAPGCHRLACCQPAPAVAHGVFDLTAAQTDVGEDVLIKLLQRSSDIPQVELVTQAACELCKISQVTSERARKMECGAAHILSH